MLPQHGKLLWAQVAGRNRLRDFPDKRRVSSLAHVFVSTAIRDTSIPPSPVSLSDTSHHGNGGNDGDDNTPSNSGPQPLYTAAQLSRAAAQSIRLACQNSSIHEAHLIVHSLRMSERCYKRPNKPQKHLLKSVAIDFGRVVPSGLSVHSLIHGLYRKGYTNEVIGVVTQVISEDPNLQLRGRTVDIISKSLISADAQELQDSTFRGQLQSWKNQFVPFLRYRDLKQMDWTSINSSRTRLAAQLFFAARQHKKQRTKQMFQQLVDACLLQGEIIVVAFLFAFLIKQWQMRLALSADSTDDSTEKAEWVKHVVRSYGDTLSDGRIDVDPRASIADDGGSLSRTLKYIKSAIFSLPSPMPHAVQSTYEEAAQALAILAGMLSEGLIRNEAAASLISILTSFPSDPKVYVQTQKKGCPGVYNRRFAREYFDEVLDEVLKQVTTEGKDPGYRLSAYNSILHYALHRKLSPTMGESVLKRMQTSTKNILPDSITVNILLSAGTRLRRRDMTELNLSILYKREELPQSGISENNCSEESVQTVSGHVGDSLQDPILINSRFHTLAMEGDRDITKYVLPESTLAMVPENLRAIFSDDFSIDVPSMSDVQMDPDIYTLCAFIEHLVKTGSPGSVVDIIFHLIPELSLLNVSTRRSCSVENIQDKQRRAEERAAALGPHLLTSVLNAIVKLGRTGLADRIWNLAKKAEKRSWELSCSQTTEQIKFYPWVLPIAAYTLMLQCYGSEMRKGLRMLCLRAEVGNNWKPAEYERHVLGWARHVLYRLQRKRERRTPYDVARIRGAEILISATTCGERIYTQLMDGQKEGHLTHEDIHKSMQLPVPDERFFNAALRLFGSLPGSYILEDRASPCQWRRINKRQLDSYLKTGRINFPHDPLLIGLVKEMHNAGFGVPEGYKHRFIGVYIPPPSGETIRKPFPSSPYHECPKPFHTRRLHDSKRRGLPVSKKRKIRQITLSTH